MVDSNIAHFVSLAINLHISGWPIQIYINNIGCTNKRRRFSLWKAGKMCREHTVYGAASLIRSRLELRPIFSTLPSRKGRQTIFHTFVIFFNKMRVDLILSVCVS